MMATAPPSFLWTPEAPPVTLQPTFLPVGSSHPLHWPLPSHQFHTQQHVPKTHAFILLSIPLFSLVSSLHVTPQISGLLL